MPKRQQQLAQGHIHGNRLSKLLNVHWLSHTVPHKDYATSRQVSSMNVTYTISTLTSTDQTFIVLGYESMVESSQEW